MTKLHMTIRPPRRSGSEPAPVALLVHGTMDRSTSFTRMAQRLPEWTIVTYDRRGYAGSSAQSPSHSFADQIDDLFEVLDSYEPGTAGHLIAFGHSLGGDVVLGAASSRPHALAGAVVYETPASWEPWWPRPRPDSWTQRDPADIAEGFMRQVIGDNIWERLPESTRRQRRSEGRAMMAEIAALGIERPFDPARISIPVIVARGAQADERHVRSSGTLAATIPGAELRVVDGADHGAHLSHPGELADLLRQCLALAHPQTARAPKPNS